MATNLVQLDQARRFLNKGDFDTGDDSLLLTLIAAASDRFYQQTGGRTFPGEVPGDVQLAALQYVAVFYKNRSTIGLIASTSGTGNVEQYAPMAAQLSGFDAVCESYRIWSVG